MITEIFRFNREIIEIEPRVVAPIGVKEYQWLVVALHEELREFKEAKSMAEEVDALIDLCYFAVGGLARLGLTETQAIACFQAVHQANMSKKRGVKKTRPNDGSVGDAVKDETFKDPTEIIREIIGE